MSQHDSDGEGKISIARANRRIAKPIMEKKRRARINASLNELKSLLVEVLQREGCRHSSKMEKADILEMAVRHLKNLQCQQKYAGSGTPTLRDSYPPAIPLEKYASALPPECLPPEVGRLLAKQGADTKQTSGADPNPASKTDTNRTILPAPQPINATTQVVQNPVMTRTPNGEIAVVLPQHILKQANHSSGVVVPIYTLPADASNQRPVMLSINMPVQQSPNSAFSQTQSSTSSAASSLTSSPPPQEPISPVWRPW